MSDEKRIDLQKHVSPKVSRRYLIRFAVYAALVAGLLLLIYFFRNQDPKPTQPKTEKNPDAVEEIRNYEIDTTS